MSEYDCRAGFGTHSHGRESSADAADSSFDLSVFAKDSLRMLLRLFWLPLLLAVVFSALFCYNAKRSYRPMYKASATFTVNVVGMSPVQVLLIIPSQLPSSLREPFRIFSQAACFATLYARI